MLKVTFTVSAAKLEKLLAAAQSIKISDPEIKFDGREDQLGWDDSRKPKKARANGAQILSMTGKQAMKGTNREKILVIFEKLEKKHGISQVDREMLKDACWKRDLDPYVLSQLINEGYLKVL